VILDAQTLLAYFDRTHERHWSAAGEIELLAETERLVVSPFVVVELERAASLAVLAERDDS